MENIINRHRNLSILVVVLFAQILGLAVQVKKGTDEGSSRLIRVWAVSAITPIEKSAVYTSRWFADVWRNYLYLRDARRENAELRDQIERMRLEQVRVTEDAAQARRLQALLGFKEQFISQTMAAQVISTTGSDFSRGIFIDKGSRDGMKPDMPVITPDGVVGKVFRVYPTSSLVLEINDPSSGAGVIFEQSRLQGILKGSPSGETFVGNIMADEKVQPGERILTSGGDRVYPKGMTVGTVSRVTPAGTFLNVEVKPSAHLNQLEEVLVITRIIDKSPQVNDPGKPMRAIDILAERLPSVPPPKPEVKKPPVKTEAAAAPKPGGAPAVRPPVDAAVTPAKPNPLPAVAAAPKSKALAAKPAPEFARPELPAKPGEEASGLNKPAVVPAAEKAAADPKPVADPGKPDIPAKDPPR